MAGIKEIRLCGFGGQGIVLAGAILGHAVVKDGQWVAESNSYGAAARGGNCKADVIISDSPIIFPRVIKADILIAMYQSAYEKCIADVKENGIVIYDEQFVSPGENGDLKHVGIPATRAAVTELNNRQVANIVILSAAVEATGIISKEALLSAVKEDVPERFLDLNLKAIDVGGKLGIEAVQANRRLEEGS